MMIIPDTRIIGFSIIFSTSDLIFSATCYVIGVVSGFKVVVVVFFVSAFVVICPRFSVIVIVVTVVDVVGVCEVVVVVIFSYFYLS
ncbi:hypothetical protein DRP04_15710 [Archaeoglobales archaeon]|nr:MAG: hypothetical protein DRP04_15710 [Archaeoglobales archaeon]